MRDMIEMSVRVALLREMREWRAGEVCVSVLCIYATTMRTCRILVMRESV